MIWFLSFLACYRLTRLITADVITLKIRQKVADRSDFLGYLVSCDWCLSIWLAPVVTVPVILWSDSRLLFGILFALSLSAIVGLLSLIESRLDR